MSIPSAIQLLIDKYLEGTASEQEKQTLQEWFLAEVPEEVTVTLPEGDSETLLEQRMLARIHATINGTEERKDPPKLRRMWVRWAAAAILLLTIASAAWFYYSGSTPAGTTGPQLTETIDVPAPLVSRAVITLADGKQIFLDSAANGNLFDDKGIEVEKIADGQIVYKEDKNAADNGNVYHTLTNPRGSRVIDIVLSDGSHIWLNAESSLRFPVAFSNNERRVEITGEAYFEVTKDIARKFIVQANGVTTQVLGTHFNVNVYKDEAMPKVTLLEGLISVSNGDKSVFIKPGQQAQITDNIAVANNADMESVMAWKNGQFSFTGADVATLMRQVEKWYDVDVVLEGDIPPARFRGKFSRANSIAETLKLLEASGIRFRIEGKKIFVKYLAKPVS